jgi:hypothetical protein
MDMPHDRFTGLLDEASIAALAILPAAVLDTGVGFENSSARDGGGRDRTAVPTGSDPS